MQLLTCDQGHILKQLHQRTALNYFIYYSRNPSIELSDILLGILLAFNRLDDCSPLLTIEIRTQTLTFVLIYTYTYMLIYCI